MVKGFAKITKPLNGHYLIATGSTKPKKNRNIIDQWTPEYQDAFDALKWKLVEVPEPIFPRQGTQKCHPYLGGGSTKLLGIKRGLYPPPPT